MNIYCLKCKAKTLANDVKEVVSKKNKMIRLAGKCSICSTKVSQFKKKQQ